MIDKSKDRKDSAAFNRMVDSMHDALETATKSLRRGLQTLRVVDAKGAFPRIEDLSESERSELDIRIKSVSIALQELYAFFGLAEDVPPVKEVLFGLLSDSNIEIPHVTPAIPIEGTRKSLPRTEPLSTENKLPEKSLPLLKID